MTQELATLISSNAVPTTKDSALLFQLFNGDASAREMLLRWRVLLDTGELLNAEQRVTLPANDSLNAGPFQIGVGQLIDVSVADNSATAFYGQVWADISLIRYGGGVQTKEKQLANGYVYNATALSWPDNSNNTPRGDTSPTQLNNLTDPGTATDYNETINGGSYIDLIGFKLSFSASANVATRTIDIYLAPEATNLFIFRLRTTVAANESIDVMGIKGGAIPADNGTYVYCPIPESIEGGSLALITDTASMQAGDEWSNGFVMYRPYTGAGL